METIIDAIKYLKEKGCVGISCEDCPLNNEQDELCKELCNDLGDLAHIAQK